MKQEFISDKTLTGIAIKQGLKYRRNYNSTNISTISFDCWDIFSTLYCFINIYKRVEALNTRF